MCAAQPGEVNAMCRCAGGREGKLLAGPRRGRAALVIVGRGSGKPTCLGEADDLGALLLRLGAAARLPVQAGDLDAAVVAHLAGVQLAQRRHQGRFGHGVGDVGSGAHLEAAQDVPLDGLQELAVHRAGLLLGGPSEATGGASVLAGGSGRGWRGAGARQQHQQQQEDARGPPQSRPVHAAEGLEAEWGGAPGVKGSSRCCQQVRQAGPGAGGGGCRGADAERRCPPV